MIFVTGATGNAGSAVVRAATRAGEPVRALIRGDEDRARLPAGVQGVVGDLNDPATLADAFAGVDGAFMLSGYEHMPDTLDLMRQAGVARVVLLSSSAAPRGDTTNAVARYHIESEGFVRESGIAWTFLQPNSFMSNTLRWLAQMRNGDVIRLPFAEVAISTIDPDDLGAVALLALTRDGHEGRSYRLSGPEALLPAEQVATLARVLGRELRFEAQPDDEAYEQMSKAMPAEYVNAFFDFFAKGNIDETTVQPTVEEVTGRPPRTFEEWAVTHADAFR